MNTSTMAGQPSGIHLNTKALIVAFVAAAIIIYSVYSWSLRTKASMDANSKGSLRHFNTWKAMDFVTIPQNILDAAADVKISQRHLTFEFDGEKLDLFIQEVIPEKSQSKVPVLLLHGAAFTSETWSKLRTIQFIAAFGFKVIAIDIPGFGQSHGKVADKAGFLAKFIHQEKLDRPVIVSPSMSGQYSIPYIMGEKPIDCTERVRGFVPVAPTGTDEYTHAMWYRCETPTAIVYGTEDKQLGLFSLGNLRNLPNSEQFPLEKAKHPAYLDKPNEWHALLYNFLLAVERDS